MSVYSFFLLLGNMLDTCKCIFTLSIHSKLDLLLCTLYYFFLLETKPLSQIAPTRIGILGFQCSMSKNKTKRNSVILRTSCWRPQHSSLTGWTVQRGLGERNGESSVCLCIMLLAGGSILYVLEETLWLSLVVYTLPRRARRRRLAGIRAADHCIEWKFHND